ncbi:proteoglycan 4 [Triplophysa rosa]|uniref:Titin n=1 Tax=Triplophysa rosa TaxID=992332 RepID=A0A9W7WFG2_TRIRA|nr:proteoglycan 4 [Triplophysa rosa]KAI7799442.1 putative titin [Triplophysa rosa]
MEQNESIDFKSLKARFQGENNLKIPTKPVIPEKPKSVPPLPAKVSNPLISSIHSAVKKGTLHAPRVVFRDDKNLNHQLSPTWGSKGNEQQPASNSELLDNNQKREGDIPKRPIKYRNLPLVLPVPPIKAKTPEPETSPLTPVSVSPAIVSTPKKFVFNPTKTGNDVVNLTSSAERSPLTPQSVSPARVSTPKTFIFNTTNAGTDTVENPKPALRTFDYSPQSRPAPANPSITATAPSENVPIVPKALMPPQTSAGECPVPSISVSSIPAPHIPTSPSLQPKIPEQAIPKPAIRSQAVRKPADTLTETPPKPNINLLSLSEVFPPPQESPPPDFTDIPPPIFPDEDFPDEVFSDQAIPRFPASISPTISRTSSPAPPTRSTISPELLLKPYTSRQGSVATPSPPPTVLLDSAKSLMDKTEVNKENQTSPKSPLSFLARAEEMSPVKRTAPLDNRVFNLLERAKKMSTMSQLASTPENTSPYKMDAPTVALSDALTPDMAQPDLRPTEKALPQIPTAMPEEASTMPDIFEFPPVDYADHAHVPPESHLPETPQVNGFDHRQLSPGFVTVVKPVNPPTPPIRKPLPATPVGETPPEKPKPPSEHLQIPTTPTQHLEAYDEQPYDNSFDESFEDTEEFKTPPLPNFRPIPPVVSGFGRPTSVHEKAFLEKWDPNHQAAGEMLPNTDYRDNGEVDFGSVNSSSPQPGTHASLLQDHVRSSPVSQGFLSPSGDNVYEDLSVDKKAKNKKQKGPPKNPYADAATAVEETPKKGLFSRKDSAKVAHEKELKKEKQREKEKEREKERERKEQKEKEKKENEIKKKFKITGQEEPIYNVKVMEDCKGRKNDLPVKVGETVSIIRTTSCPKGKWLAKDSSNRYGYVPVESMDLNIAGIKELGKMTTVTNRPIGNGLRDAEHTSTGSRTSDHNAMNNESFSDDSEEWTCDDDDPTFSSPSEAAHIGLNQTPATPMRVSEQGPVQQTQTDGNYTNAHAKHEALQKLSTFFTQPNTPSQPPPINKAPILEMPKADYTGHLNQEEEDLDIPYFKVLPPPDLYADIIAGDSVPIYSKPIKTSTK